MLAMARQLLKQSLQFLSRTVGRILGRTWLRLAIASFSVVLVGWGCATALQPPLPDVPDVVASETIERPLESKADTGAQHLPIEAQATIGDREIYLEVAKTPQQQQIGLMFRQRVGPQCGMVFPFEPARPVRFWMQNVPISLDMIFLRADEVRAIEANVPPCDRDPCPLYGPQREPVDRVVELAGGRAAELGLVVGDRLEIQPLTGDTSALPCP